ncbi:ATP-binding protein [Paenibacillus sp. TRM 82003]|nr:ATP-binding protein [Paenibacillus sp. TRM 82003]
MEEERRIFMEIRTEDDLYYAINSVRSLMESLPFLETEKQCIFVTISELSRNLLDHAVGGRGYFICQRIEHGISFTVKDNGPGINGIDTVLAGGHRSSKGLGLGLAGAKRLMDEFLIETTPEGTTIIASKWTEEHRKSHQCQ